MLSERNQSNVTRDPDYCGADYLSPFQGGCQFLQLSVLQCTTSANLALQEVGELMDMDSGERREDPAAFHPRCCLLVPWETSCFYEDFKSDTHIDNIHILSLN